MLVTEMNRAKPSIRRKASQGIVTPPGVLIPTGEPYFDSPQ